MLLDASEDKNPKRKIGFPLTPLHYAVRNGYLPICEIIVENLRKTMSKKKLLSTLENTLKEVRSIWLDSSFKISKEGVKWINGVQFGLSSKEGVEWINGMQFGLSL